MRSQTLEELRTALEPYLFFWKEWSKLGVCELNPYEIDLINRHIQGNFRLTVADLVSQFVGNGKFTEIHQIIDKLEKSTNLFRVSVVIEFLTTLIKIAQEYPDGYDSFFLTQIKELKISKDLVEGLMTFKVHNVHLLVFLIKPEDFSKGWIFRCVSNFIILNKNYNLIINQKPIGNMKTNSS